MKSEFLDQFVATIEAEVRSRFGTEITRKNLYTQPTIKVPIGHKFTVRVNRDVLFDGPYQPSRLIDVPVSPPDQLKRRTAFPAAAME
jgi:hypothetical protein